MAIPPTLRARSSRAGLTTEELDEEPNRPHQFDVMLDLGRDGVRGVRPDDDRERGACLHSESQPAVLDRQPAPHSARHAMGAAKGRGNGVLVPDFAGSHDAETLWELGPVAERAVQRCSDSGGPFGLLEHPWRKAERRRVANVLRMQARQLGDPVAVVVLDETHDRSPHGATVARLAGDRDLAVAPGTTRLGAAAGLVGGVVSVAYRARGRASHRGDDACSYTVSGIPTTSRS